MDTNQHISIGRPLLGQRGRSSLDLRTQKQHEPPPLTSLSPTPSRHPSTAHSLGPGAFHTLPNQPQHDRRQQHVSPPPTNYYFGCHPSHRPQNIVGMDCNLSSTQHFSHGPQSINAPYLSPQHREPASVCNEELDKGEDLIYESIYDSRWRLLNQVRHHQYNSEPLEITSTEIFITI